MPDDFTHQRETPWAYKAKINAWFQYATPRRVKTSKGEVEVSKTNSFNRNC